MIEQNTQQPLQIVDGLIYRLKAGCNCDEISVTMWNGSRTPESRAEGARRVLACVNACSGITTERLQSDYRQGYEPWGDVMHLTKQRDDLIQYNETRTDELAASVRQADDLKKQRDGLLTALKLTVEHHVPKVNPLSDAANLSAIAAIAAVDQPASPDADGWIKWHCGERPVPWGTMVEIILLCGDVSLGKAECFKWGKVAPGRNIVAYRVVQGGA